MRGNRLRRVFRCTLTDAPVGDGVPDGPHRRTFEYWRTLVYPSVGVGFYPARRLYFAFSFLPPAGIFRAPARHPFAAGGINRKIGGALPRRFTSYFSRMAAKNALSSARLS